MVRYGDRLHYQRLNSCNDLGDNIPNCCIVYAIPFRCRSFRLVFGVREHSHFLLHQQRSVQYRGLCRMKMLPVMILANYHSSARSAVLERPNSSARLVSQCPNSSARLVSQCPNSSARLVFPMFQVELRLAFECSNSNTNDRQFEVCLFGWFFHNNYYFLSQYAFHV